MKQILLILLILPLLIVPAFAEEYAAPELGLDAVVDALPSSLGGFADGLGPDADFDGVGALEKLWDMLLSGLGESLRACAKEAAAILGLTVFTALGRIAAPDKRQGELLQIAGCCAASLLLAEGMSSMLGQASSALQTLNDYATGALPAIYSAAAACGMPVSAPARYGIACLALDLLMTAARRLILPMLHALIAMAVCGCIHDNPLLRSGQKLIKRLCVWILSGLCLSFSALLGLTGVVAGSTDAASVKAAKTVIGASVPVVGRILSDAASSLLSAANVVRASAGVFGLAAVCAICCAPFASLAVRRLLLSLVSSAAEMSETERMARLLSGFGDVLAILLGLIAAFGLMLFVSIASAIRSVSA